MPKKKTKKKTAKKKRFKPVSETFEFCEKCGFHELYCPEHGCGSQERVGEKKSENTKRWKW